MRKQLNSPIGLITTIEAAKRIGIHQKSLRNMARGKHPSVHPIKITDKYWLWHWPTLVRDLGLPSESAAA